jgi:hypothetical protein
LPLNAFRSSLREQQGIQAEQRIKQAQYCAAVEARAQHREIERAQPASHLTPAEEAGNRKAAADRLIGPERIEKQ